MNKNEDFYRLVCEPINTIILVKKLSRSDEKKMYFSTKGKLSDLKEPISIESYQKFLIKALLKEPNKFFESLDEDNSTDVTRAIYESIIDIYPSLNLHIVCGDLNQGIFLGDIEDAIGTFLKDHLGDEPSAQPQRFKGGSNLNTLSDINKLEKHLKRNLIGQNSAIDQVINATKLIATNLADHSSFFFVGPTGVGKTELARLLGDKYSGNFFKINCAEYASQHEYAKLIGSPPGYVGHTDKSLLAEKAEKSDSWVFLFDEIEKAHHRFYDFLLSLLDEGTCTDNMGRTLDFTNSIFIFTSNAGVSSIKGDSKLGFGDTVETYEGSKDKVEKAIKTQFSPEFMNRIDAFIFFNSLKKKDLKKIASLSLVGIPIKRLKSLLDFIVDNSYSEEYGARNINRFIKNNVALKIADEILKKNVPKKKGNLYTPKIVDNELVIVDTKKYGEDSITSGI